jgi:putative tryptophan/tyrosine transport system substrate-binding protein
VRRSAVLGLALLGVLSGSLASAQSAGKTYRVGILTARTVASDRPFLDAFRRAMSSLGYEAGKNLEIVYRYTSGQNTRLSVLAAELVRANVDVIVASSSPAIAAVQHATTSVPIVMLQTSEPFRFVASLARPGGNITGMDPMEAELEGKRLQLLKELVPRIQRVAVMRDPSNPGNLVSWREAQSVAHRLGIEAFAVDVRSAQQIDAAFETIRRLDADAVLVLPAGVFNLRAAHIVRLVTAQRLPAVYSLVENVPAQLGELMMYGASNVAAWGQAAGYVDRILKGAKPADLPIERPTTFELIVNLKAAHDIGITVPQSILLRADRVIR